MGSTPQKLAAPPQMETSREIAERIWREQFGEEERREQRALARMVLDCSQIVNDEEGIVHCDSARAPRPRRSAVTGSSPRKAKRRKGLSVPRIPPSKA